MNQNYGSLSQILMNHHHPIGHFNHSFQDILHLAPSPFRIVGLKILVVNQNDGYSCQIVVD